MDKKKERVRAIWAKIDGKRNDGDEQCGERILLERVDVEKTFRVLRDAADAGCQFAT